MSISNVNDIFAAYQYSEKMQKAATMKTSFAEQLNSMAESNGATRVEKYVEYLNAKFGTNIMVQEIGNDQKSVDNLGLGTVGYNNVVIAPNILEQMANDPEKAAYYEKKIKQGLDGYPRCKAILSAWGHEIHSYGVCVHPDGRVTTYVCGDLKPEVRAKIEAKMKEEDEEKAKRRKKYLELSQEAADKRRALAEMRNHRQTMEEALHSSILDAEVNYNFISQSQSMASTVVAYDSGLSAFGSSTIGGI